MHSLGIKEEKSMEKQDNPGSLGKKWH